MVSHLLLTPFLSPLSLLLSTCYSQVVLWVPPTVGRSPTHKSLCDLRQVTPLLCYFSFLVCKVKDTPVWWLKRLIHTKVLGWRLPHEVLALYLCFRCLFALLHPPNSSLLPTWLSKNISKGKELDKWLHVSTWRLRTWEDSSLPAEAVF